MRIVISVIACLMLAFSTGCQGNPISNVQLGANPDGTFTVGVGLNTGKHLVWHSVPAETVRALQVRCPSVRMVTRAVDPCAADTRSIDGANAVLTGDSRDVARAINRAIQDEKDAAKIRNRELHEIARATSNTAGMKVRRFFTPRGCVDNNVIQVPTPVSDIFAPIPETPAALPPVNPASPSDFGGDIPPSGIIPPPSPSADKAVQNALVKRVENLESRVNGIEGKLADMSIDLKAVLAAVKKP